MLIAAAAAALLARWAGPRWHEYRLSRLDRPGLQGWVERHPGDALGHFYLGVALGRSGDTVAAAEQLAKAVEQDPKLTRARWRLAAVLAASGQADAAEQHLRQGVSLDPTSVRLRAGLGRLYERRADFRRAAAEWEQVTRLDPRDGEAWYHLGRCWIGVNQPPRALHAYRRAVERAPRSVTYRKALAGALRQQQQYREAETHCRQAVALAPDDPDAHFGLAKLLCDRDGATPTAKASLRRAVSLQPQSPLLRYSLASLLQQRGELGAAAKEYRTTLHLLTGREPSSADWDERERWLSQLEGPHFNLARLLQRLGRRSEAARHLARFREVSDYRNRVRQNLVRLANRPSDASLLFSLARLHAAAGDRSLAEERYRAGLRLQPDPRVQAELLALGIQKVTKDTPE